MGSVGRLKVIVGETARVATRKPRAKRNFMELTDNAIKHLQNLKSQCKVPFIGYRLGIKENSSGCVGASYSLQFDEEGKETAYDEIVSYPEEGIKLTIDPKAQRYVVGTKMDFQENDTEAQFIFYNPNATAVCGCGQTFSVDPAHKE